MAGIDLRERIKLINAQQRYSIATAPAAEKTSAPLAEEVDETHELVVDTPVVEHKEEVVEAATIADLEAKLDALTAEIKKMNKHVNSIAKFIKNK